MPITKSDRISNVGRENIEEFKHNKRKIKADHPPEPWPKVDRIAVIFPVFNWTERIVETLSRLIDVLCYPVRYLIINNATGVTGTECESRLGKIGWLKNLSIHTPTKPLNELGAYRYGVERADADWVYLPTKNVDTGVTVRLFTARRFMLKNGCRAVKWPVEQEQQSPYDLFIEKDHFLRVSDPGNRETTTEATVMPLGLPDSLECDLLSHMADGAHKEGEYRKAYAMVEKVENLHKGSAGGQVLIDLFSRICFDLELYDEAEEKCRALIERGYGADNWIRLGWILQRKGKLDEAIEAFRKGMEGIELTEEDLANPIFPITVDFDFSAFSAFIGMGESMLDKGDLTGAAKMFRLASKLKANSHRPFLGFGQIFLKTNDLDQAQEALVAALARSENNPEVLFQYGRLLQKKRDNASAFDLFSNIFKLEKTDPQVIDKINETGTVLERWDEMKSIFEEFLRNRPGSTRTMNYLARVYRRTGEYGKAKTLIESMPPLISDEREYRSVGEPGRWFHCPSTFN